MRVKIWSDVRCPFCYIGKKKFEAALAKFPQEDQVEIEWKSYQLDPNLKTDPNLSTLEYFVKAKGVSEAQAREMFSGATNMAAEVGLKFNLETSVTANSFMAHRLIQLAKSKGLGNEIEEALFKAHFEEAKNIDDSEVLQKIGTLIGIKTEEVKNTLQSDAFAYEVKQDEMEARNIGVRGVPFFVIDDKYAISGAQPAEAFLQTLEKAWKEFKPKKSQLEVSDGDSCATDGNCD
ncbi:DsbA family oxidoreductase [Salegentibacter salegens]|uniref:Predicted dithiol-disulfide isomerase, DsbA family n=1 Tax=Salegentibacter salegens TaxID=143223 RepID=A0A1M7K1L3_9FLAO|nr:DsbA family oxidoreductase [Salegentibacter salegens]PRX42968.1 putative DsbA family dithiol-disulfide isomerase [Salegentibacter salegens]SHM59105.1 Predicted dithiol-disulfide isomerase, DsbA family [Salegentibacter salegens]